MNVIKWLLVILAGFLMVFFLWPSKKIIPQIVVYKKVIAVKDITKITLVYNAKADRWSVFKDFFVKEFTPAEYPCNLCSITFGTFSMKQEWKTFLDSLPIEKEYLHKDEFAKKYSLPYNEFPVIFVANANAIAMFVSQKEINSVHSLPALQQLIQQKLRY
ncbi:MAG: hypothetical protein LH478_01825 [Chitinophagaceae bacterium]|nr:hypothetical protein [Chitinophagaceae bacterium]